MPFRVQEQNQRARDKIGFYCKFGLRGKIFYTIIFTSWDPGATPTQIAILLSIRALGECYTWFFFKLGSRRMQPVLIGWQSLSVADVIFYFFSICIITFIYHYLNYCWQVSLCFPCSIWFKLFCCWVLTWNKKMPLN